MRRALVDGALLALGLACGIAFVCLGAWVLHAWPAIVRAGLDRPLGIASALVAGIAFFLRFRWLIRRRSHWFRTYTGRRVSLFAPRATDFDIDDIARALSHTARFNGHTDALYTVAQHVVLASRVVAPEHARAAFCHDWPEAYTGDVIDPLKRFLPGLHLAERRIARAMGAWIGVDLVHLADEVHQADHWCFQLEAASLTSDRGAADALPSDLRARFLPVEALSPERARAEFMTRYRELFPERAT